MFNLKIIKYSYAILKFSKLVFLSYSILLVDVAYAGTEISIKLRPKVSITPRNHKEAEHGCAGVDLGYQGYVILGFTVTKTGSVKDPYVIESTADKFIEDSKRAALKFKYKPRVVDGVPVEVQNVKNKLTWECVE